MKNGVLVNLNAPIDYDTSYLIGESFGIKISKELSEDVSVSDLMDAYRVYFDTSYQNLQKEITKTLTDFSAWDIDESLKNLLQEIEGWHKILNNKVLYDALVAHIDATDLKATKEALQLEIEKKSKDFNHACPVKTTAILIPRSHRAIFLAISVRTI